jgi:hypothetical protein
MMNNFFLVILLSHGMSHLFAQSYDLKEVDEALCRIGSEDQQIRVRLMEAVQNASPDFISIKQEMDSIDAVN